MLKKKNTQQQQRKKNELPICFTNLVLSFLKSAHENPFHAPKRRVSNAGLSKK